MPRKPVAARLISEHGVVKFHASVIPPSQFLSYLYCGIGHGSRAVVGRQPPSEQPSGPGRGGRQLGRHSICIALPKDQAPG